MTDWAPIQIRLGIVANNIDDTAFYAALFEKVAGRPLGNRGRDLGVGASSYLRKYEIDQPLRLAHFLGQCTVESGNFQFMKEIWGPTPAQKDYEGRLDLGNTQPGDGKKYMGRGLIDITGRSNYEAISKRIGMDLIANPELAERPDIAVLTAADWWSVHGCNALADKDEGIGIGRLINRGNANSTRPANGELARVAATLKFKAILL